MRYSREKSQEFPSGNPSRARKISIRDEIREIKGVDFVSFSCVSRDAMTSRGGRTRFFFSSDDLPRFPGPRAKKKMGEIGACIIY